MKKIFVLVVGLLAAAFIIFSFSELENILLTLRQSHPLYLLVAVGIAALLLVNSTATFASLYRLVGLQEENRRMLLMVTAASFVNVIAPSAGFGGMAVFIATARKSGLSAGRVTLAGILYLLYEYASLFVTLLVGFFVLLQRQQLGAAELMAAGFILLLAAAIGGLLALGSRSPEKLGDVLAWLAKTGNYLLRTLRRRNYFDTNRAREISREITEGISELRANQKQAFFPILFTLNNKLLLILILALSFRAMGTEVDGGTVLAGFSISQLFIYASVTPSGIGFVDSILPVALTSLEVPTSNAVLVTLVYRAVSFWLPLGVGGLAFRHLERTDAL